FGIVAFTSAPPFGATRKCACLDLVVSTDRARTYVRRPTSVPSPNGLFGAATAADPTTPGAFTVMTTDSAGDLLVYRTADAGKTWTKPARLVVQGRTPVKAWMAYSPTGVLGIGWRGQNPDGSYGFYAAVSSDHGAT